MYTILTENLHFHLHKYVTFRLMEKVTIPLTTIEKYRVEPHLSINTTTESEVNMMRK